MPPTFFFAASYPIILFGNARAPIFTTSPTQDKTCTRVAIIQRGRRAIECGKIFASYDYYDSGGCIEI